MTDAELARLDPAVQALAMLTGLSFVVELQLAVTMSHLPAEQARGMAGVMVSEWRARAALARAAAGDGSQLFDAAGLCVDRIVSSAMGRADTIRTTRSANAAAAAAMATMPPSESVN